LRKFEKELDFFWNCLDFWGRIVLFTSEAIPRGTIFCGEVRGFRREGDNSLPELSNIFDALNDSKQYFQSLGIGGMTTRGFGRMEMTF